MLLEKLIGIDWDKLLVPTHSIAEIALRGSVMYLCIFLIFRFWLRQSGGIGIADVLVIVLIADAAQNAFAHEYKSLTEGIFLVLTIVFWDFMLDWLGYHTRFFAWLTRKPTVPLIEDGKILWRNLRREMITCDELESLARKNGLKSLNQVATACMEENGEISLIERPSAGKKNSGRKRKDIAK
jgi:uncharacterized membrane protein YcaP (DUF421 family)